MQVFTGLDNFYGAFGLSADVAARYPFLLNNQVS